jgi:lysophospholipase L1-like esterase
VVVVRRLSVVVVLVLTLVGFAPAAQAGTAVPTTLPTSMAAAGDSITRAYDATLFGCFLSDCTQYSWATGTSSSVNSQLARLRALQPGIKVTAANVAKTGARVSDLDRQLKLVGTRVQYVTVLIGANDVCTSSATTMTSVASFQASFTTALTNFFGSHRKAYLFVSSIPNIYQLWDVLKDSSSAQSTWSSFGICQSMLSSSNTEDDRQAVLAREQAFNGVLETVCAQYARCRWDAGTTYGVEFARSDVSTVDYFHPAIAGQAKLAAATWSASYWG